MASVLDQLRDMTVVVADTGELEAVKRLRPVDCTTNPSLGLGTLKEPAFEDLVVREIEAGRLAGKAPQEVSDTLTVAVVGPCCRDRPTADVEAVYTLQDVVNAA